MKLSQYITFSGQNWEHVSGFQELIESQLLLVFGSRDMLLENKNALDALQIKFPKARLFGCSTAGEIIGQRVEDQSIVATAVEFEKSRLEFEFMKLPSVDDCDAYGKLLVKSLSKKGLRHIFVLTDGQHVNGTQLVKGLTSELPSGVNITGGLAADGALFKQTLVFDETGKPAENIIAGLGLYGDHLEIGYGSFGGWDSFGIERQVTKSVHNEVFEIDHSPALALYKSFLGDQAQNLPASGLLFPLSMRINPNDEPLVRTILNINEETQSLTFAGDVPEGAYVKLMKANFDRLISGAEEAAIKAFDDNNNEIDYLSILISCVGRKLVLKQLVEEETEIVKKKLGEKAFTTGFYSYGEISPFSKNAKCELHNQTMTITTIREI
jgi:hypothetical protein